MEKHELNALIEAILFAADEPLSIERLSNVLEGIKKEDIREAIKELKEGFCLDNRGLYIEDVANGYQMRTKAEYSAWIRRLYKTAPSKISKASMETLAMIAYRQPVTRGEVESIRGVDSAAVLKTLMDRRLVRIVGRQDLPGRPVVYGTTREFLEVFGLNDLSSLPSLKDMERVIGEDEFGETTEDNSECGHSLETQGRGDDPRIEGQVEREDNK
ncbi:MAG: SMC-Scp complex subunit ScpB [Deltaproteobacteria bacterium]|nr:SMC-Scp complex subunit ScpB [Deltaproteobacteria bacterium]